MNPYNVLTEREIPFQTSNLMMERQKVGVRAQSTLEEELLHPNSATSKSLHASRRIQVTSKRLVSMNNGAEGFIRCSDLEGRTRAMVYKSLHYDDTYILVRKDKKSDNYNIICIINGDILESFREKKIVPHLSKSGRCIIWNGPIAWYIHYYHSKLLGKHKSNVRAMEGREMHHKGLLIDNRFGSIVCLSKKEHDAISKKESRKRKKTYIFD